MYMPNSPKLLVHHHHLFGYGRDQMNGIYPGENINMTILGQVDFSGQKTFMGPFGLKYNSKNGQKGNISFYFCN